MFKKHKPVFLETHFLPVKEEIPVHTSLSVPRLVHYLRDL